MHLRPGWILVAAALLLTVSPLTFSQEMAAEHIKNYATEAAKGNPTAQFKLGVMYFNGEYVNQDKDRACKCFEKAAAQNHPLSQYSLALMYDEGNGVGQDKELAKKWFGRACDNGHAHACREYAKLD